MSGALEPGTRVGRFVVQRAVGSGGMGAVYQAHDPDLGRPVALKVLHGAEPGEQASLRLIREAQALAQLQHENVVTVYEVGASEGRIFIAMELVPGRTLDVHLGEVGRDWRALLPLFLQAGRGLEAAHAHRIVHRDFKPHNVLVSGARVRVGDFGLARAAGDHEPRAAEGAPPASASAVTVDEDAPPPAVGPPGQRLLEARLTGTDAYLGTPRYMAPEQRARQPATEKSDQYAFSVAFWEALFGAHPADTGPAPPGAPRWLVRVLEKGLEVDPARRHASMSELLSALERGAARSSARRRGAAIALGAAAIAGAAALAVSAARPDCTGSEARVAGVWDAAARQRVRASFLASGHPAAEASFEKVGAAIEARLRRWVSAHQEACLATHVRGEQSEALLDRRMACLERARGQIAAVIALWGEAVDVERALAAAGGVGEIAACEDLESLAAPVPPPRDREERRRVEAVRGRLDRTAARVQAGKPAEALVEARGALAEARAVGYAPVLAEAMLRAGRLECEESKVESGAALLREAVVAAGEAHDDRALAVAQRELIACLGLRGQRLAEAAALFTVAEAGVARAGKKDDLVEPLLEVEGLVLLAQARHAEAAEHLERAVALAERLRGPSGVEVAGALGALAQVYTAEARWDEALVLWERVRGIQEQHLGADHASVAATAASTGVIWSRKGEPDRAAEHAERAVAIGERVLPADSPVLAQYLYNLGSYRDDQERDEEARALIERALAMRERALGKEHPHVAQALDVLAKLALDRGDAKTARAYADRGLAIKRAAYGEEHPSVAFAWSRLADILEWTGEARAAREAYERALGIRAKAFGERAPELTSPLRGIGLTYLDEKRWAEAVPPLERARAILVETSGGKHPQLARTLDYLGTAYLELGRRAEAEQAFRAAVAIVEEKPADASVSARARFGLARILWGTDPRRARALALEARATLAPHPDAELAEVDAWLASHRR